MAYVYFRILSLEKIKSIIQGDVFMSALLVLLETCLFFTLTQKEYIYDSIALMSMFQEFSEKQNTCMTHHIAFS